MTHYLPAPDSIQFEISSNCNSLCLSCCRQDPFDLTKVNPRIPKNQFMAVEDFKRVLTSNFFRNIEEIFFCGSIDDPIMHPKLIDMVVWTLEHTNMQVTIDTNGGARSPKWWTELAEKTIDYRHMFFIKFNIDGLGKTNAMFRQLTRFDRIMENAKAFITGGGRAYWQFIIFPWNEHQIEAANQLAMQMGFEKFRLRKNSVDSLNYDHVTALKTILSDETTRQSITKEQYISDIQNRNIEQISCRRSGPEADEQSYMISFNGEIWPCCFLYNDRYQESEAVDNLGKYNKLYGENWNSIHHHTVDEIMCHPFFTEHLVAGWENLATVGGESATSCSPVCAKICGKRK